MRPSRMLVAGLDARAAGRDPGPAPADVRAALDAAGGGERFRPRRARRPAPCSSSRGARRPVRRAVLARFGAADGMRSPSSTPTPAGRRRSSWNAGSTWPRPSWPTRAPGPPAGPPTSCAPANVDARLLGLLAGLVTQLGTCVGRLPARPRRTGRRPTGPSAAHRPRRRRRPVSPSAAATEDLVEFLEAQRPPFAPDTVELDRRRRPRRRSATRPRPTPWSTTNAP